MTTIAPAAAARKVSRARTGRRGAKRRTVPVSRAVIRASRYPVCNDLGMLSLVAVVGPAML